MMVCVTAAAPLSGSGVTEMVHTERPSSLSSVQPLHSLGRPVVYRGACRNNFKKESNYCTIAEI